MKYFRTLAFLFLIFLLLSCQENHLRSHDRNFKIIAEHQILEIKLSGNAQSKRNEFSGLAWRGNDLILLPQYVFNKDNIASGKFYSIPKERILEYIAGKDTTPISPITIPINIKGFSEFGKWGSGCEAIAFEKDTCYLSVEINEYGQTNAIIMKGIFENDSIKFFKTTETKINSQSGIQNLSEETIGITKDFVFTIHEANGENVNPYPKAHLLDKHLNHVNNIPFPHIEYRITDATSVDSNNNLWVINFFYPGDKSDLQPAEDEIAKKFGIGKSHSKAERVERILQLHFSKNGITLSDQPPLYLKLSLDKDARNWEGIARLDTLGFLIITDTYPRTIFGFVRSSL